ncbi:ROK family transcriptional regulator [Alteromonas sp. ALT199]|uniref:ROK family transcriptional regulator n=1 Tax=unclassified Alteromonas TaxID=2614992 RepID=UPI000445A717|nr:ROK family transcriptional regulator [Alteromonas sp. ALT199]MBT3133898.1 ROK family transcriptional regulator [Alteromonas sp. ALT199]
MNIESAFHLPSQNAPELVDNRSANERAILTLIRQRIALPKAEIAQLTGLSAQSATVIIKKLETDGLVKRLTPIKGGVGQPKVPFGLNANGAFSIGLKVGRRSFDMTLLDLKGNVKATLHEKFAYPTVSNLLNFAQRAFNVLTKNIDAAQQSLVRGLGVAMPFEIWSWAEEAGAPKKELEEWKEFDPQTELESLLNLPVFIKNDAGAACSAEMSFGNPKQYDSFLYIFVGTFLGGGLVLNNQLINGKAGNAGAIGSLPFFGQNQQRQLITQSSLYLLERELEKAGEDAKHIYESPSYWQCDESLVKNWVCETAKGLAFASQCAMSLLDLDGVIIDGAIPSNIKEQLVEATQSALKDLDMRGIKPAQVSPGHVGVKAQSIGSANLALQANYF